MRNVTFSIQCGTNRNRCFTETCREVGISHMRAYYDYLEGIVNDIIISFAVQEKEVEYLKEVIPEFINIFQVKSDINLTQDYFSLRTNYTLCISGNDKTALATWYFVFLFLRGPLLRSKGTVLQRLKHVENLGMKKDDYYYQAFDYRSLSTETIEMWKLFSEDYNAIPSSADILKSNAVGLIEFIYGDDHADKMDDGIEDDFTECD